MNDNKVAAQREGMNNPLLYRTKNQVKRMNRSGKHGPNPALANSELQFAFGENRWFGQGKKPLDVVKARNNWLKKMREKVNLAKKQRQRDFMHKQGSNRAEADQALTFMAGVMKHGVKSKLGQRPEQQSTLNLMKKALREYDEGEEW